MFDDQTNKASAPTNLPTEPDDMFAGVEKDESPTGAEMPVEKVPDALDAGLLKKKEASSIGNQPTTPMPSMYEMKQPILGKIILFLLLAVVLGGVGFGGWFAYTKFVVKQPVPKDNKVVTPEITEVVSPTPVTELENSIEAANTLANEVTTQMNNDSILFGEAIDSDKDGLDDVREKELGIDPYKADTDSDGLNDGDEVIIWKTDPLNKDTDGDSYLDGEEVKNSYNPLGPGKLNIPTGLSTSSISKSVPTTNTAK